jgi:hypothetical protein
MMKLFGSGLTAEPVFFGSVGLMETTSKVWVGAEVAAVARGLHRHAGVQGRASRLAAEEVLRSYFALRDRHKGNRYNTRVMGKSCVASLQPESMAGMNFFDQKHPIWRRLRWLWFVMGVVGLVLTPGAVIGAVKLYRMNHNLWFVIPIGLILRLALIGFFFWLWWKFRPAEADGTAAR